MQHWIILIPRNILECLCIVFPSIISQPNLTVKFHISFGGRFNVVKKYRKKRSVSKLDEEQMFFRKCFFLKLLFLTQNPSIDDMNG